MLKGDLLDLDREAMVSLASRFGFMNGGIDRAIDRFYDGEAQVAVPDRIDEHFHGILAHRVIPASLAEPSRAGSRVKVPCRWCL